MSGPFAERWNGSHWAISVAGLPKYSPLNGVSCIAANQCLAVGQFDPRAVPSPDSTAPFVTGWDGERWSRVAAPDAAAPPLGPLDATPDPRDPALFGISCRAEAGCTAVGAQAAGADSTTLIQTGPNPAAGPPRPPAPLFGHRAAVRATAGSVSVQLPGSQTFVPLTSARSVPLGTIVDATGGTVKLTAARGPDGRARASAGAHATQSGLFHGGAFRLGQRVSRSPFAAGRVGLTVLTLSGPLPSCAGQRPGVRRDRAHSKGRHLWGGAHGDFQTGGRYGSATVGGTRWLTEDSCAGTRVKVARGIVSVNDRVRHRTVLVRAPHSYLARAGAGG
jgi:hypothetical protein